GRGAVRWGGRRRLVPLPLLLQIPERQAAAAVLRHAQAAAEDLLVLRNVRRAEDGFPVAWLAAERGERKRRLPQSDAYLAGVGVPQADGRFGDDLAAELDVEPRRC